MCFWQLVKIWKNWKNSPVHFPRQKNIIKSC